MWTIPLALVLVATLAAAGCAEDVVPPPPQTAPPLTGVPTGTAGTTGTAGPTKGPAPNDVAWVPPGPIGTISPTCPRPTTTTTTRSCGPTTRVIAPTEWQSAFTSRDCAAIGALGSGSTEQLYRGLGKACAAASGNNPDHWAEAQEAWDSAGGRLFCTDKLAYDLLGRILKAHQRRPQARIRFTEPAVSAEKACNA